MMGFDVFFVLFIAAGLVVATACVSLRTDLLSAGANSAWLDAQYQSRPNWGWPKTVGYTNPTGPIPSIVDIAPVRQAIRLINAVADGFLRFMDDHPRPWRPRVLGNDED